MLDLFIWLIYAVLIILGVVLVYLRLARKWLLLPLAFVVVILLAGCGGAAEAKGEPLPGAQVTQLTGWTDVGSNTSIAFVLVSGQPCILMNTTSYNGGVGISCNWDTEVKVP